MNPVLPVNHSHCQPPQNRSLDRGHCLEPRVISRIYRSKTKSSTAILFIGNYFVQSGEIPFAIECYKEGLIMAPNSISLRYALAKSYLDHSKLEEAVSYLHEAVHLASTHPHLKNFIPKMEELNRKIDLSRQSSELLNPNCWEESDEDTYR